MADRTMFEMLAMSRGLVLVAGSFQPNGSGTVNAATVKGHGFSVAWSATGVFDVTLEDAFVDYVAITTELSKAALADEYVRIGSIDLANKTFEILAHDGATPAALDIAEDADTWIHFLAFLKNTSVPH